MYTYTKTARRFISNGNELMRYTAVYPRFDGLDDISNFYATISSNCETWCEKAKTPSLSENIQSTQKPLVYTFEAFVTYMSDELVSIRTDVVLKKSKKLMIFSYTDAQIWRISDSMLLPPKYAYTILCAKTDLQKGKMPKSASSVMLCENSIYTLTDKAWVKLEKHTQKAQKLRQTP